MPILFGLAIVGVLFFGWELEDLSQNRIKKNSKEYKDKKNSLLFVVVLTVMLAMVV